MPETKLKKRLHEFKVGDIVRVAKVLETMAYNLKITGKVVKLDKRKKYIINWNGPGNPSIWAGENLEPAENGLDIMLKVSFGD